MATAEPIRHTLAIMDASGDTKAQWDPSNPDEVAAAREMFNKMKKKGYTAYRVSADGEKGEIMTTFDPQARQVIMAPAMRGG